MNRVSLETFIETVVAQQACTGEEIFVPNKEL